MSWHHRRWRRTRFRSGGSSSSLARRRPCAYRPSGTVDSGSPVRAQELAFLNCLVGAAFNPEDDRLAHLEPVPAAWLGDEVALRDFVVVDVSQLDRHASRFLADDCFYVCRGPEAGLVFDKPTVSAAVPEARSGVEGPSVERDKCHERGHDRRSRSDSQNPPTLSPHDAIVSVFAR